MLVQNKIKIFISNVPMELVTKASRLDSTALQKQ